MNEFYVYVYLDPRKTGEFIYNDLKFDNEPFYVGKGKGDRLYKHMKFYDDKNKIKINKLKKILSEGFEPIILKIYEQLNEDLSFEKEIETINKIGQLIKNTGPLTNVLVGGKGGDSLSSHPNRIEICKKMSKIKKGRILDDNHKNRIIESHTTKEYREKMSMKMIELYSSGEISITEETKNKISKTLKNKNIKRSEETKNKIGEANKNRFYDEKMRKNMSDAHIGISTKQYKYILISPNNKIYEFIGEKNFYDFLKINNMSDELIRKNINNGKILIIKRKTEKTINTIGWEIIKQKI